MAEMQKINICCVDQFPIIRVIKSAMEAGFIESETIIMKCRKCKE